MRLYAIKWETMSLSAIVPFTPLRRGECRVFTGPQLADGLNRTSRGVANLFARCMDDNSSDNQASDEVCALARLLVSSEVNTDDIGWEILPPANGRPYRFRVWAGDAS